MAEEADSWGLVLGSKILSEIMNVLGGNNY